MKKYLLFFIVLFLVGCGNTKNEIVTIETEDLVIKKSEITEKATFYNYKVDDVVIQIFAVKASDNSIRVLFNTCASCNPSPKSYFVQKGKYFECQNCKNKYTADEIGLKETHGCSPIPILEKEENKKTITISKSVIVSKKDKFKNINIYGG